MMCKHHKPLYKRGSATWSLVKGQGRLGSWGYVALIVLFLQLSLVIKSLCMYTRGRSFIFDTSFEFSFVFEIEFLRFLFRIFPTGLLRKDSSPPQSTSSFDFPREAHLVLHLLSPSAISPSLLPGLHSLVSVLPSSVTRRRFKLSKLNNQAVWGVLLENVKHPRFASRKTPIGRGSDFLVLMAVCLGPLFKGSGRSLSGAFR